MRTTLVTATYERQNLTVVELSADVIQDSGEGCSSELCVVWTDECLATLAEAELDMHELVGAQEAIESAYWASEWEAVRVASVRQRAATEAA